MHVTAMLGEAYYELREYRRAEVTLKEALQLKKELPKIKSSTSATSKVELDKLVSEMEVKYILHKIYLAMLKHSEALNVLQSVPAKQRTPRFNMALGSLYMRANMDRPAIPCFREVLK